MSNADKFSVVLPVFNEQDNLETLFSELKRAADSTGRPWEAVFVDDTSTDASLSIIQKLAEAHDEVRYVALRQSGQSAAFCAGFDAADSDIIITMDSDLQNDPADIPAMLELFGDECEMVIGWRAKRRDTFIKEFLRKLPMPSVISLWMTACVIPDVRSRSCGGTCSCGCPVSRTCIAIFPSS